MLRLNCIYPAFMGEVNKFGIGVPCTFVRLAGCNLRCYLSTKGTTCDTPEALDISCGKEVSVTDILNEVVELGNEVVCLTGGEPLMQDVTELLVRLTRIGCKVVVETNGSRSILPYRHIRGVSFIVDYKSTTSGEQSKMIAEYSLLNEDDFIKFVVDTEEDYEEAKSYITEHQLGTNYAIGCFWGSKISYQALMHKMHTDNLPAYLNMQTHKMACLYDHVKENSGVQDILVPKNL